MTPANVDDIVASVEDAVRRAYALGRADAMKRVVELAQTDDPGLRAMALLGPAEPARPDPSPALLGAPAQAPQPAPHRAPAHAEPEREVVAERERLADEADAGHEDRQASAAAQPVPAASLSEPSRDMPTSVGGFLADFFYPLGSKKR